MSPLALTEKASQLYINVVISSKKMKSKNKNFSSKNLKKYLKSKNDIKGLLGAFNQVL